MYSICHTGDAVVQCRNAILQPLMWCASTSTDYAQMLYEWDVQVISKCPGCPHKPLACTYHLSSTNRLLVQCTGFMEFEKREKSIQCPCIIPCSLLRVVQVFTTSCCPQYAHRLQSKNFVSTTCMRHTGLPISQFFCHSSPYQPVSTVVTKTLSQRRGEICLSQRAFVMNAVRCFVKRQNKIADYIMKYSTIFDYI